MKANASIDNLHLSNIFGSEAKWAYLVSTPFPHSSREREICTSVLAKTWALREVATFGVAFQAQSLKMRRSIHFTDKCKVEKFLYPQQLTTRVLRGDSKLLED